jgi:hypothetical protein
MFRIKRFRSMFAPHDSIYEVHCGICGRGPVAVVCGELSLAIDAAREHKAWHVKQWEKVL